MKSLSQGFRLVFLTLFVTQVVAACELQNDLLPDRKVVYKSVGNIDLELHVIEPADHVASGSSPAIVFFFGGGLSSGTPGQFYEQARLSSHVNAARNIDLAGELLFPVSVSG